MATIQQKLPKEPESLIFGKFDERIQMQPFWWHLKLAREYQE